MFILFVGDENSLAEPQEFDALQKKFPDAEWWGCDWTKLSEQAHKWRVEHGYQFHVTHNNLNIKDYPYAIFQYCDRICFCFGHAPDSTVSVTRKSMPNAAAVQNWMERAKKDKIPVQRLVKPFREISL